jgi:thioredoxin 1
MTRLLRSVAHQSFAAAHTSCLRPNRVHPTPGLWHAWTRAASNVVTLSDANAVSKFVSMHPKSVLYYTATWCPPCKQIAPIYESLSSEYHPEIAFGKVDVDENSEAAAEYEISAVPTFIFCAGANSVVDRFSGADRTQLATMIQKLQKH